MIKLGNLVSDAITGYSGIVIARTDWLFGCVRMGIECQTLDKDGKPAVEWFDEQRLSFVSAGLVPVEDFTKRTLNDGEPVGPGGIHPGTQNDPPGGDRADPVRSDRTG